MIACRFFSVSVSFRFIFVSPCSLCDECLTMGIHVKTANKHAINLQRCMFACDDKLNTVHCTHRIIQNGASNGGNDLRLLLM